jgi:hypothetical protein
MASTSPPSKWYETLGKCGRALRDIFYGMTTYEMVRDLRKERARLEHLFVLITMGDLLGIPILPPYYSLRLLPYVVPQIEGWRCCLLRERDLTDLTDFET